MCTLSSVALSHEERTADDVFLPTGMTAPPADVRAAVHVKHGPFFQHTFSVLRLLDIKKDIAPLIIKLILDFLNYLFFSKFPFLFSDESRRLQRIDFRGFKSLLLKITYSDLRNTVGSS